jgi:hypothetical protein
MSRRVGLGPGLAAVLVVVTLAAGAPAAAQVTVSSDDFAGRVEIGNDRHPIT